MSEELRTVPGIIGSSTKPFVLTVNNYYSLF